MNNRNPLEHLLKQHQNGEEADKLVKQLFRNYGLLSMLHFTHVGWLIFIIKSLRDLQTYRQVSRENHK